MQHISTSLGYGLCLCQFYVFIYLFDLFIYFYVPVFFFLSQPGVDVAQDNESTFGRIFLFSV